jgi:hypothetical protein
MKKLLFLFIILMGFALGVNAQLSPTTGGRIANATTAFGVNLSVGSAVYDLNTNKLYVCKTATVSTLTLTTGSANFQIIGGNGIGTGTVTDLTAGLGITFGGSDIITTGTVAVDTANVSILSRERALHEYQLKALASAYVYVGNASGVGTAVLLSNDVTMSNTGAVTIAAGAVTLAKMANETANTILGNNTGSPAAPAALSVANTLTLLTANQAQNNFVAAHDSTSQYIFQLTQTPRSLASMTVNYNGKVLTITTDYIIVETNKLKVLKPVYQYDNISATFPY